MVRLPERKAGIVACSGEELAEGTVTRLAALKVLHELRPGKTVTICLPLFLAGGEGDRAFARAHPTITVDGCELRCAARGTELFSGKPAASLVVNDLLDEQGLPRPEGRRRLNEAGKKAVEVTAARIAELVDQVLESRERRPQAEDAVAPAPPSSEVTTCACGSRVPVMRLVVDGKTVEVVALPLILRQFRDDGRSPDEGAAREIVEAVKVYNAVPPEAEDRYREAVLREYAAICGREAPS